MAEVSEARAVPQPPRPSGAVWGVRGGSGGDAEENAFVSQAPSHKEKNKKKRAGGVHTSGGVRGWPCPGRREAQRRAAGPGCRAASAGGASRTGAGPAPQSCPGSGTARPQRRWHLPGWVVRPGRTVLLGVFSGITSVFFTRAHGVLRNIAHLQKRSFSRVFHMMRPSPGGEAPVCSNAVAAFVRNISYV